MKKSNFVCLRMSCLSNCNCFYWLYSSECTWLKKAERDWPVIQYHLLIVLIIGWSFIIHFGDRSLVQLVLDALLMVLLYCSGEEVGGGASWVVLVKQNFNCNGGGARQLILDRLQLIYTCRYNNSSFFLIHIWSRIQERRVKLLTQIEDVRRTRALQRSSRKRHGGSFGQELVTVAVVGYTNAVCGSTEIVLSLCLWQIYSSRISLCKYIWAFYSLTEAKFFIMLFS
jgi:hypothetical protein